MAQTKQDYQQQNKALMEQLETQKRIHGDDR